MEVRDPMVLPVLLDQLENRVAKDQMDPLEIKATAEFLGKLDHREARDSMDYPEAQAAVRTALRHAHHRDTERAEWCCSNVEPSQINLIRTASM